MRPVLHHAHTSPAQALYSSVKNHRRRPSLAIGYSGDEINEIGRRLDAYRELRRYHRATTAINNIKYRKWKN